MSTDTKDLELLLDGNVPILVIESLEEPRVLDMLTRIAIKRAARLWVWSITEGLKRLGFGTDPAAGTAAAEPEEVLQTIKRAVDPAIYILCDFHPYISSEPKNIRLLREIAMRHQELGHTVVLLSHQLSLPGEISRYSARFELSMPTDAQLMRLVGEEAANWSKRRGGSVKVNSNSATLAKLVNNLRGVSLQDARQLIRGAIHDGAIVASDLPELNKAKFALMDMEGVLSFEYDTSHFAQVGGLTTLKAWLEERRPVMLGESKPGLDAPKGILLLGIQGSGKSLAARAVAGAWSLPLLRLDFGALYNKYFGETERNLRDALALADTMSPCILWLDEIEKGISSRRDDSGMAQRLLGTLLTWMAERRSRAFIVETSNDISQLPPELVRKGRLDEIFFVDLPVESTRAEIFAIHLAKRGHDVEAFDLGTLAALSEGFSGAEIEQAVVSAMYAAAAADETLANARIEQAVSSTNPLSIVMRERVLALRVWAQERCVFAD